MTAPGASVPSILAPTRSVPNVPAPLIIGAAVLAALVAGRLFAAGNISLALAIVLAACYVPLLLLNFQIAFAVYAGMLYVSGLPALSVAPAAIGILLIVGWLVGCIVATRPARLPVLEQHRGLVTAVVLLALWLGLSRIWTEDPGLTDVETRYWAAPLTFVIVAMTFGSVRHVRIIVVALLIGAVVSVLIGLSGGGLASSDASDVTSAEQRLTGGGGDPNTQAAAFIAAIFFAGAMLTVVRRPAGRVVLLAVMALVAGGAFATQSRSGLLGLGVGVLVALIVTPRYRGRILSLMAATAAGLGIFLLNSPNALRRFTQDDDAGSGRQDIWTVAWNIFQDHPLLGTGLNSFQDIAPQYVLDSGPLTYVRLLAESPRVVHNSYLQLLAENGIVGLAIFIFIVVASLRASWLAARCFDAIGQSGHANLSRAVLAAAIGMLTVAFFVSNASDSLMWILFALGPVMLTVARSEGAGSRTTAAERPTVAGAASVVPRLHR